MKNNYDRVKEQVEYFEERILINFDKHFNYLVLEDFYTGGSNDRIEDEWFYEEYFEQYENDIIHLLLDIEQEDERFYDFQLRLIRLKRIIDNKLIKIGKASNELNPIRQSRINYFLLKDNISEEIFINILFEELISKKFIDCTKDEFSTLFSNSKKRIKIQWKGTELQITLLINSLLEYFDTDVGKQHFKLIEINFINKKGNNFKHKQLGSVYHEKLDTIASNETILKIIKKMSTHLQLS